MHARLAWLLLLVIACPRCEAPSRRDKAFIGYAEDLQQNAGCQDDLASENCRSVSLRHSARSAAAQPVRSLQGLQGEPHVPHSPALPLQAYVRACCRRADYGALQAM